MCEFPLYDTLMSEIKDRDLTATQKTELIKKIEQVDMGDPVNLIKRRFALGGVRSGFKTFSFGAAAGVGGAAAFGPAPVIAGLFEGL